MKGQSFVGGVVVLTIATVLVKILGAMYRIPLTWVLGAEGLGLYQLVFPIFSLLLVLSSTGMPLAICKMVSFAVYTRQLGYAKQILKVSLILLGGVGLLFSIAVVVFASTLASMQNNPDLSLCYYVIAPAIFFVSILSCFRGYFQGFANMIPTAISQIIEQVSKLVLGLGLGYYFSTFSLIWGVVGALCGVTIGEIIAVLILCILYLKNRKQKYNSSQSRINSILHSTQIVHFAKLKQNDTKLLHYHKQNAIAFNVAKDLIKTAVPIVITSLILPLITFVESVLVINLLSNSGLDVSKSTQLWGINTGVINSLVNLPLTISMGVAVAVVPNLAKARTKLNKTYTQAVSLSAFLCLPIMICFVILAPHIIDIIYQDSLGEYNVLASQMLIISSTIIVFGAILQVQNSSLQAIGKGQFVLANMFFCGGVKLILFFVLVSIPNINIWGSVISFVTFYTLAFLINYLFIRFKLRTKSPQKSFYPSIFGAVLMLMFMLNFELAFQTNILLAILEGLGGIFCYLFGVVVFSDLGKGIVMYYQKIKSKKKHRV